MYFYFDLETRCDLDIKHVSLDRYAAHPSCRILMCSYAEETGPVSVWEQGDEPGRQRLVARMQESTCVPWNCGFEKTLLSRVWKLTNLKWRDAMVASLYAGMPAGLKDCNKMTWFAHEAETSKEAILINKFCKPQKDGGIRGRDTDPEDWQRFCDYCAADTHDTRLIWQWIQTHIPTPEVIWQQWEIDQRINERGMPIDRLLTLRAWEEAQRLQSREQAALVKLTGLDNPNSTAQLLPWLAARGYPYTSLGKELVLKALQEEGNDVDD